MIRLINDNVLLSVITIYFYKTKKPLKRNFISKVYSKNVCWMDIDYDKEVLR